MPHQLLPVICQGNHPVLPIWFLFWRLLMTWIHQEYFLVEENGLFMIIKKLVHFWWTMRTVHLALNMTFLYAITLKCQFHCLHFFYFIFLTKNLGHVIIILIIPFSRLFQLTTEPLDGAKMWKTIQLILIYDFLIRMMIFSWFEF